jgi:hypothetical protein
MNWIKHHKVLTVLIAFAVLIALGGIANAVSPPKPGKPAAAASSSSPTPVSSPTPTRASAQAGTYSSVQDVINALNRGGLPCTGGTSVTPVAKGATSETLCKFDSSSQAHRCFPAAGLANMGDNPTNDSPASRPTLNSRSMSRRADASGPAGVRMDFARARTAAPEPPRRWPRSRSGTHWNQSPVQQDQRP